MPPPLPTVVSLIGFSTMCDHNCYCLIVSFSYRGIHRVSPIFSRLRNLCPMPQQTFKVVCRTEFDSIMNRSPASVILGLDIDMCHFDQCFDLLDAYMVILCCIM